MIRRGNRWKPRKRSMDLSTTRIPTTKSSPAFEPGSELGWTAFTGPNLSRSPTNYFRFVILKEPNWDFHSFDLAREYRLAEKQDHADVLKAIDPDLKKFLGRADGSIRLYMAPGMGHCAGGDGPSVFHMVDPLE
jgi:feruloyl esterase